MWPRIWTRDYRDPIQPAVSAGLELGAYGLQVQRSNLSATLLPHIVKLLRILPLLDWVLFSRFSAPPNLQVKTLATSFVIRSWWETLGTTLNLWCVIIRLLFQGIFYFRREKNTLDTSRFIKVVDHRNDCQNVELPAKTHFEGLIFGGTYVQREIWVSKSIGLALFLEGN